MSLGQGRRRARRDAVEYGMNQLSKNKCCRCVPRIQDFAILLCMRVRNQRIDVIGKLLSCTREDAIFALEASNMHPERAVGLLMQNW
jgi:hypothetical protein